MEKCSDQYNFDEWKESHILDIEKLYSIFMSYNNRFKVTNIEDKTFEEFTIFCYNKSCRTIL